MRSDVMYRRETDRVITPQEEQALLLYQQAETLEVDGEHMKAMEAYRKAFRLCPELERSLT